MLLINLIIAFSPSILYFHQLTKRRTQPLLICHLLILSTLFKLAHLLVNESRINYFLLTNCTLLLACNIKLLSKNASLTILEERLYFLFKKNLSNFFYAIYFFSGIFNFVGLFFFMRIIKFNGVIASLAEIASVLLHISIARMERRQSLSFTKRVVVDRFLYRISAVGEFLKAVWMLTYDVGYSLVFCSLVLCGLDVYISC